MALLFNLHHYTDTMANAPLEYVARAPERHKLLETERVDANAPLEDNVRAPERQKLLKTSQADATLPSGDHLRALERSGRF